MLLNSKIMILFISMEQNNEGFVPKMHKILEKSKLYNDMKNDEIMNIDEDTFFLMNYYQNLIYRKMKYMSLL